MGLDVGEVKSQLLLDGRHEEEVLFGFRDVSNVHA